MKTRGGVYYDLLESDIIYKINDYEFKFSSELYKNKFVTGLEEFIKEESNKINSKYGLMGDFTEYLTIIYYKKVEKRGFYVTYKDKLLNPLSFKYGEDYGY